MLILEFSMNSKLALTVLKIIIVIKSQIV